MTVKSSDVLRLAAEYAFNEETNPLLKAIDFFFWSIKHASNCLRCAELVDYESANNREQQCMALCLAAAIAESEGD